MKLGKVQRVAGQRFARLATNAVVARPRLWRFFRAPIRKQFDLLAPVWDELRFGEAFAPLRAALDALPQPPARALDLGTGTGMAAFAIGERFPQAEIVGADLSERMLEEAWQHTAPADRARIRFELADASRLPYGDGAFDLVVLANMIPFFDELARVAAPGGHVVLTFSSGAETPIYVPFDRLRRELGARGFADFADFEAGGGTALLARKRDRS